MADIPDDDKQLAFDLHFAVCLQAMSELSAALNALYASVWLMTKGDDDKADEFYQKAYSSILELLAAEVESLTVTDDFRQQYQEQINGTD